MAKKKRKISPAHLAALRAAGKRRRGKKRGPYKTPIDKIIGAKIGSNLRIRLPNDYQINDDLSLRKTAIEAALKTFSNNHENDADDFIAFAHKIFEYLKDGKTAAIVSTITTEAASTQPKEKV